jgi:archaellum component FlaC
MAKATLTQRVEALEHKVHGLATLPARVGAVERELKEFRADVDAEFGRVHVEFGRVHVEFGKVHTELAGGRDEFATVRDEFATVRSEFATVRSEIRQGDEETRRYMRVLYEELVERIKIMGEGIEELRRRS